MSAAWSETEREEVAGVSAAPGGDTASGTSWPQTFCVKRVLSLA